MADIVKTLKFLVIGDTAKASSSMRALGKEMQGVAKSGSGLKGLGASLRDAVKSGKGLSGVKSSLKGAVSEAGGMLPILGKVGILSLIHI